MKIKSGFSLRCVGNENLVVEANKDRVDFSRVIILNESSARLWTELADREFTVDDVAGLLCQWYDVEVATAESDAKELLKNWYEAGMAE